MISPRRARELATQAERLFAAIQEAHPTPRAARLGCAYAHTLNRLLDYKLAQLGRAAEFHRWMTMTDDEILEAARAEGIDVDAQADRMRALFERTVERIRKEEQP
jgi:DNA-binding transcriptional LysR family regulator